MMRQRTSHRRSSSVGVETTSDTEPVAIISVNDNTNIATTMKQNGGIASTIPSCPQTASILFYGVVFLSLSCLIVWLEYLILHHLEPQLARHGSPLRPGESNTYQLSLIPDVPISSSSSTSSQLHPQNPISNNHHDEFRIPNARTDTTVSPRISMPLTDTDAPPLEALLDPDTARTPLKEPVALSNPHRQIYLANDMDIKDTSLLPPMPFAHSEPVLTIYVDPRPYSKEMYSTYGNMAVSNPLKAYTYPQYTLTRDDCAAIQTTPPDATTTTTTASNHRPLPPLPINDFPDDDPYLPWIHDYFSNGTHVVFVAQNKRRCETGHGKEQVMQYYEPHISFFQTVGVVAEEILDSDTFNQSQSQEQYVKSNARNLQQQQHGGSSNSTSTTNTKTRYRLAEPEETPTVPETRFQCYFHTSDATQSSTSSHTTFSVFPFNYEYVAWRKRKPMFVATGPDVQNFEFSQLLFACPIPASLQSTSENHSPLLSSDIWLDVIPIRTLPRKDGDMSGLTVDHIGPEYVRMYQANMTHATTDTHQDVLNVQGKPAAAPPLPARYYLPEVQHAGRWANFRVCPVVPLSISSSSASNAVPVAATASTPLSPPSSVKHHEWVICTWTAASYQRRGDATTIEDSAQRLLEWILFHQMVGVDHIYIYDNTHIDNPLDANLDPDDSLYLPLRDIARQFSPDNVTYHRWTPQVCNNNRPNHQHPGERSSQYAAEASCRERYGPYTRWMAFIDTDEYLVPMQQHDTTAGKSRENENDNGLYSWKPILQQIFEQGFKVLKLKSSRGRPRLDLMHPMSQQETCIKPKAFRRLPLDSCLVPQPNTTFLQVYNCDYIKPPRPERFERAMKQIYQPSFVLSHFVHYSTVTQPMAQYYRDSMTASTANMSTSSFHRGISDQDWGDVFLDELTEGALIHAKSVLPHETRARSASCYYQSKRTCMIGIPCPDSTEFVDENHTKNVFVDQSGQYCNCWYVVDCIDWI
jgi:hypothetical protein